MRDLHAFNVYEHSRNSATDHLSPAIASPKEKIFIPAWLEPGISESGGVFDPSSGG